MRRKKWINFDRSWVDCPLLFFLSLHDSTHSCLVAKLSPFSALVDFFSMGNTPRVASKLSSSYLHFELFASPGYDLMICFAG